MLLQNEALPNCKFSHGREIIETDAKGCIEIKDKEACASFLASGFKEVPQQKHAEKVMAKKAMPIIEDVIEDAVVAPVEQPKEEQRNRWSRSK